MDPQYYFGWAVVPGQTEKNICHSLELAQCVTACENWWENHGEQAQSVVITTGYGFHIEYQGDRWISRTT